MSLLILCRKDKVVGVKCGDACVPDEVKGDDSALSLLIFCRKDKVIGVKCGDACVAVDVKGDDICAADDVGDIVVGDICNAVSVD